MIRLIFLLFTLITAIVFCSLLLNISFAKSIPVSFLIIYIVQYLAQLFGKLSYLKVIILGFYIIFFFYILFNKKHKEILIILNNGSFYIFVTLFFILYFISKNIGFTCIDDFFYWGIKVKNCLCFDNLYSSANNSVILPDSYPPFPTILELFFCKILGGYSESTCLFSMSIFSISCLIPCFDKQSKNIKKILFTIIFMIIICFSISFKGQVSPSNIFNSLYVDWPLGILVGYTLYCIVENSSPIYISSLLTIIILSKQIALPLFILLVCYYFITLFISKNRKSFLKNVLFVTFIPLIFYFTWKSNLNYYLNYMSSSNVIFSSTEVVLNSVISPKPSNYFIDIISNFFHQLFFTPISGNIIGLSYVFTILLITFLLFAFCHNDKVYKFLPTFYLLGSILYMSTIIFSYVTIFSEHEAMNLAEFSRYLQVYILSGFTLLYFISCTNVIKKKLSIITLIIMCLFFNTSIITTIFNPNSLNKKVNEDLLYKYASEQIGDNSVMCVSQNNHLCTVYTRYMFFDKSKNLNFYYYKNDQDINNFIDDLKQYKYLYIAIYDDYFQQKIWNKITDSELYNNTLYTISYENDKPTITIEKVFEY